MKSMNITEKILAAHAGREFVDPGENIWVDVAYFMTHDVFGPDVIRIFQSEFGHDARVWDKNKFVLIPDHYIFTTDKFANKNIDFLSDFAGKQQLPHYYAPHTQRYSGVCHITLAQEGFDIPGGLLIGTDSHTCTSGAFGMFATGIGTTDGAFALGTGKLWLKVPKSIKVIFNGRMPSYLTAKDLIIYLLGDIGFDGATYKSIEFDGEAIREMTMEDRMTLCNMAIEAGAKNGIIAADEITIKYMEGRAKSPFKIVNSDPQARYCLTKEYDVTKIDPVVAKPHSPDNRACVRDVSDVRVDRAYIGSCTGGKIEDFIAAAKIIKGRSVAVDTYIVPATEAINKLLHSVTYQDKLLYDIFLESGCKMGPPSCAACLGGPVDTFGRAQDGQVIISATNRNFPGRMGSPKASVYLASPYTVMSSAVTGKITDPRTFLKE